LSLKAAKRFPQTEPLVGHDSGHFPRQSVVGAAASQQGSRFPDRSVQGIPDLPGLEAGAITGTEERAKMPRDIGGTMRQL